MRQICMGMIRAYRYVVSPLFRPSCRFDPTCSQYALDAIGRYGVLQGVGMAFVRLLKCHPFHPGGVDPVK